MARTLLAGTTVLYDGDPLRNLTLAAFLDKFVQKKPKVWLANSLRPNFVLPYPSLLYEMPNLTS